MVLLIYASISVEVLKLCSLEASFMAEMSVSLSALTQRPSEFLMWASFGKSSTGVSPLSKISHSLLGLYFQTVISLKISAESTASTGKEIRFQPFFSWIISLELFSSEGAFESVVFGSVKLHSFLLLTQKPCQFSRLWSFEIPLALILDCV